MKRILAWMFCGYEYGHSGTGMPARRWLWNRAVDVNWGGRWVRIDSSHWSAFRADAPQDQEETK